MDHLAVIEIALWTVVAGALAVAFAWLFVRLFLALISPLFGFYHKNDAGKTNGG